MHKTIPSPKEGDSNPEALSGSGLLRAAQYLRVSTEHQQYSIANQVAAIALYAAASQHWYCASLRRSRKERDEHQGSQGITGIALPRGIRSGRLRSSAGVRRKPVGMVLRYG